MLLINNQCNSQSLYVGIITCEGIQEYQIHVHWFSFYITVIIIKNDTWWMSYYIHTHTIVRESSSGIRDKVLDYYSYGREFNTNIGRGSLFKLRQSNLPRVGLV